MKENSIIGLGPFERPDVNLTVALEEAGIFPVIHLGRSESEAVIALESMQRRINGQFGVCFPDSSFINIQLPQKTSFVILPVGITSRHFKDVEILYQVTSLEEAKIALANNAKQLIIKGNESAGYVGEKSSFILFQEVKKNTSVPLWIQGGMGIHSAAAVMALGARGIVLDSQLALFPQVNIPDNIRNICKIVDGSETNVVGGFRVLIRPNSPKLSEHVAAGSMEPLLGSMEIEKGFIPMGQDIGFANELFNKHRTLRNLADAFHQAFRGHLHQAHAYDVISEGNAFSKEFNIRYPIAQGPMTRVSDVSEFAESVAQNGGLPFIALSLMKGEKAKELLMNAKKLLQNKTWGVGILGFVPGDLRKEQLNYIEEVKPPVVLIAGGRPSQAKPLEKLGIKTFLHVPSIGLLDVFLKEGARRFVFEGRECGGHVGPLSSFVLWEKQIERLLDEDEADTLSILFAGGIHDAFSAAIVSVMCAPLAAKGAKIGVLMGTSYLYTREAVESGAILKEFQEQAIIGKETVLVETGAGHITRCLNTPFVNFFKHEKEKLISSNTEKNDIRQKLEELNVGRLRIAAKGLVREGNSLEKVSSENQKKEGMYMIGQVVALRDKVVSMMELHQDVVSSKSKLLKEEIIQNTANRQKDGMEIAIIGMACLYPGSADLQEYWKNIVLGNDCVTEVPEDRWSKERHYDVNAQGGEKTPSKWGGFIPDVAFDSVEFGIPPHSMAAIDPTQLLSLKIAKDALADAGYADKEFDRENTSVIFGLEAGGTCLSEGYSMRTQYMHLFDEMPEALNQILPSLTEDSFPGVLSNVVSGRIANRLNFGGRNYIVDAACATSLTVLDVACQDLAAGRSSMVVAGGVDLHNSLSDYLFFSSTKALSRKGKCMAFDAEADGIALGEGVAVVILKRLADATKDGDRVYAVIKGVGASSDGKSLGLTAPRKLGQLKALERAYQQAGISPADVGLMEAHGTGTVVGDRTELTSMTDILTRSGATRNQTHLGSVKTQIGHTKCAAGMAGLIKMALSIYHGIKPPTINLKRPNKFYNEETSPFAFNTEAAGLWEGEKRIGGVSAFGFGGTNFHAVLEKGNHIENANSILKNWPCELLVFRGETLEDAFQTLRKVKTILCVNPYLKLRDLAYSLAISSTSSVQLSIIATDQKDLLDKIDKALQGTFTHDIYKVNHLDGKVAFLFSGQGSQRVNMARELFIVFPAMRNLLLKTPEYIKYIFPNTSFDERKKRNQSDAIKDTQIAQPLLGIVDYSIASFLRDIGMEPDMVAGHSYGELPALCFAGVFDKQELVKLSEKRAEAILKGIGSDPGAMLAVSCKEQELPEIMTDHQVYLSNHNSPSQLVVSGSTEAIDKFADALKAFGKSFKKLEVACAFHSPLLSSSPGYFKHFLDCVKFEKPSIDVWSNTSAAIYPDDPEQIKQRLADHLVKPVRFSEEIKQMYAQGARIFIETGPGKTLASLVGNILPDGIVSLHAEQKDTGGILQLMKLLAGYISTGKEIRFEKLFESRDVRQINLESPDKYKLSATTWKINGNIALPLYGNPPAHGASIVSKPIINKPPIMQSVETSSETSEKIVLEYLKNMNLMMQAQRDVILGYIGQNSGGAFIAPLPLSDGITHALAPVSESVLTVDENASLPNHGRPGQLEPIAIQKILLDVVREKTGYPSEMLGMDMDLEADLSIDSIKRVEIIGTLKTRLAVMQNLDSSNDQMVEELTAIKTLNGLVTWIISQANSDKQALLTDTFNKDEKYTNPDHPQKKTFSRESIKNILLKTISEKTGYPTDMLGLDMDLEADLSIDSIKRVEIISDLKNGTRVLQSLTGKQDEIIEALASIKTLNGLIDWIAASSSIPGTDLAKKALQDDKEVKRFVFDLVDVPFDRSKSNSITGKNFLISDSCKRYGEELKKTLQEYGALADVAAGDSNIKTFYDGLIFFSLSPLNEAGTALSLFKILKAVEHKKLKWLYVVSDYKDFLAQENNTSNDGIEQIEGFSGFTKSLNRELDSKCLTINIEHNSDVNAISGIVMDELVYSDHDTVNEIYYKGTQRLKQCFTNQEIHTGNNSLTLTNDSVVLVLGGAQGITADILKNLSRAYPCHYILVGRSPDPFGQSVDEFASIFDKDEIRKELVATKTRTTPRDLETSVQHIFKRNKIIDTVESLTANGASVTYLSVDLRNQSSVKSMLDDLYTRHDRIDGVIHAAGFLDDKLFSNKSFESFENVYCTKVNPLKALVKNLRTDVQFLVFFSSIASVVGNRGQTDYASANSALDAFADIYGNKNGTKIMSINWGPWKGSGMVSATLEKEYNRRGIGLLSIEEGVDSFINELRYGKDSRVMYMTGDPAVF